MLRVYKPIEHDIFTLHKLLSHVVKEVWCKACDDDCEDLLQEAFKKIYHYSYKSTPEAKKTLKDEIERIYDIFKDLEDKDKAVVRHAFEINNQIEKLCDGGTPVYLNSLPDVIEEDIKPLFVWCYEELLDKGKVAGDKLDYYQKLIDENEFDDCPCCSLMPFEGPESICREAYDHYLPKSEYPFASVNFKNLVPLCYKCNSDRKKAKDPIEKSRKAFYPFGTQDHNVEVTLDLTLDIDNTTKKLNFTDLKTHLNGDKVKVETWNWLFDINDRYGEIVKKRVPRWSRELANRYRRNKRTGGLSMREIIDDHLEDYEPDKYTESKFLKIAFLNSVKSDEAFLAVYE